MNSRVTLAAAAMVAAMAAVPAAARAEPVGTPTATPPAPSSAPVPAPSPASPPREEGQHFTLDPVADGALTGAGFGFSLLLGAVLSTGEITPPQISQPASALLSIDRSAVSQTIDKNAGTYSNIGLYAALGFAVVDPLLSGLRDGWDATLVDGFMYAESGSLALTLTDITKIAVRRPRPIDYVNCPPVNGQPRTNPGCGSTDLGLSFFSGHASGVAAVGATATYIAFVRSHGKGPRPWITLGVATALTAFVGYERVRSGEHFPTDVITGSIAGAAIGVLVPHLHRHVEEAPPVWIGLAPTPGGGGEFTLQGLL